MAAAKKRKHADTVSDVKRILSDVKQRRFKPVYLLHGEEPYYIDLLTDALAEGVLDEDQRDFNQSVFYGQDTEPSHVANMARQYPVMAPYQVIIVKEAQVWKKWDDLIAAVKKPAETTVIVINVKGKSIDKRLAFYKEALKTAEVFESLKLTDRDVVPWTEQMCRSRKLEIDPRAAALMAEYIGADLGRLSSAVDKLSLMCKDAGKITTGDVSEHIGISKDFNIFELNRAIGMRDHRKALLIANYFANNQKQHHIIPTVSNLYSYFKKIAAFHETAGRGDDYTIARALGVAPYFVSEYRKAASKYNLQQVVRAFDVLHETDLKSKGVGNTGAGGDSLVRELTAKLLRL